jgi:hypothetical protein
VNGGILLQDSFERLWVGGPAGGRNGEAGYRCTTSSIKFKNIFGSAIRCNVAEKPDLDFSADSDRQNAFFKDLQDM